MNLRTPQFQALTTLALTAGTALILSASLIACGNAPVAPRIQVGVATTQAEGAHVSSLELITVAGAAILSCATSQLKYAARADGALKTVSILSTLFPKLCPNPNQIELSHPEIAEVLLDSAGRLAGVWTQGSATEQAAFLIGSADVSQDVAQIASRIDCGAGTVDLHPVASDTESTFTIRSPLCATFKTTAEVRPNAPITPITRQNQIVGFIGLNPDGTTQSAVTVDLF